MVLEPDDPRVLEALKAQGYDFEARWQEQVEQAADAWRKARKTDTAEAYEQFLDEYGSFEDESELRRYVRPAKARLAAIQRREEAAETRRARQEAAEQARQAAREKAAERSRLAALKPKYIFHRGALGRAVQALDPSPRRHGTVNGTSGFTISAQGAPFVVNPDEQPGPSAGSHGIDNATLDRAAPQILSVRAIANNLIVELVLPTKGEEIAIDEQTFRQIALDLRSSEGLPCKGILFKSLLTVVYVPSNSSLRLDGVAGRASVAGGVPLENGPLDQQPGVRFVTRQTAVVPLVFTVDASHLPSASELRLHFLGQVYRVNPAR